MSFDLLDTEPICDVVALTTREKLRKAELEGIVKAGFEEFLRVGAALCELRNKRLYRTEFPTFELYCRSKFGLARSSADQLIRSAQTAESLLEAGADLSKATEVLNQAALRLSRSRSPVCLLATG